jgi:hypothetical protein
MKTSEGSGSQWREDEGWDDSVLVWNATVARIPAPPPAAPDTTSADNLDKSRPRWTPDTRHGAARPSHSR